MRAIFGASLILRTPILQMLGCVLALHLLPAGGLAQTIQPRSSTEIFEIKIEGNRYVSEQKIRRVVRLKAGDRYSDQSVSEALRRLYATKEFEDVAAFKEVMGSGVALMFRVKEFPRVDEVRFDGNKKIKDDDLKEEASVKAGAFVRPALLRKDFATIEDKYREKGYYRIVVQDRIVQEEDKKSKRPKTVLVYQITEGEKVEVAHIDFFGNRALDSEKIRKVMESKEDGWFRNSDFKPKVLEEDRDIMSCRPAALPSYVFTGAYADQHVRKIRKGSFQHFVWGDITQKFIVFADEINPAAEVLSAVRDQQVRRFVYLVVSCGLIKDFLCDFHSGGLTFNDHQRNSRAAVNQQIVPP